LGTRSSRFRDDANGDAEPYSGTLNPVEFLLAKLCRFRDEFPSNRDFADSTDDEADVLKD
jgi:hypothetical protein